MLQKFCLGLFCIHSSSVIQLGKFDKIIPKYILWYMSKTLLTVKTDVTLKRAAQEVAQELGLPLGTAINAFLRQFVREREISLSASYKPTQYLRDILKEAERDLKQGDFSQKFDTMERLLLNLKKS